ncbi:MAG: TerC family protein [Rhodoluna sp.]|nr:TerC family protein [Rhodoluna sp.]MBP6186676.1 TerC family protein [Rhodoluna sp.]
MVVITGILLADVLMIFKRPHIPSAKESTIWVAVYAALALIFALVLGQTVSATKATEFIAGWLTEYSLSLDNLFVFVIIMTRFAVPKKYQQEVLMVGVVLALILRGIFIAVGAALIESFSAIFYIFGAFLLYTAWHQAFRSHDDEEESESKLIVWLRKRIEVSKDYDGAKIRTVQDGRKMFTPMLVVFIAIAATDVMFAFDSIPAIFGITTDPFIVFTANVFALMGLRQLYFLLGGLLDKLEYLKYGIAFILGFIGFKLVSHAMHVNELPFINGGKHIDWAPEISTDTSLMVIVGSIVVSAAASIISARRKNKA